MTEKSEVGISQINVGRLALRSIGRNERGNAGVPQAVFPLIHVWGCILGELIVCPAVTFHLSINRA